MLSILIPTYNYNALPLITALHKQCSKLKIIFEILCFDDGSKALMNIENQNINNLSNCHFESLPKNVGLSQNRNLLAQKAQYEYLLFIDGDSFIPNSDFISNYTQSLPTDGIVYGGRIHPKACPSSAQKLRWKYGIEKEDKTARVRKQNPYQCLLFNNA